MGPFSSLASHCKLKKKARSFQFISGEFAGCLRKVILYPSSAPADLVWLQIGPNSAVPLLAVVTNNVSNSLRCEPAAKIILGRCVTSLHAF